jgi:Rhodopirellula transposase DDE domain/Helix-turn-helix of DDE superfamily endonuclease
VNVGCDHDTAAFAVTSIRRWWHGQGRAAYPQATRLLITADAGGSNGYRTRAWKIELGRLAAETGLTISVSHLPPSTSKWNKIEHRLFSHITMNWRGRPLTSHEVIVQTIAATTNRSGLRVHAELDTGTYPTGIKIGDADMAALPLTRHTFHGDWNYVLHPSLDAASPESSEPPPPDAHGPAALWDQNLLSNPVLTGMSRQDLEALTSALTLLDRSRPGTGLGRPPGLSFAEQVLVTVLHLRLSLPAEPLALLLGSSRSAVHRTFHKIRKLLGAHGTDIPPPTSPPAALIALHTRAVTLGQQPNPKIKSAC